MDIFDAPPAIETIDPAKDYLSEYVGEGKKFADAAALARAKAESDAFIKRILDEKRLLEEDLKTRTNYQEFIDQMKTVQKAPVAPNQETPPVQVTPPSVEPDLEKRVAEAIEKREADNTRTRNLIDVQQKLIETYGNDYANRVKSRAQELGIPVAWLNDAAAKSPQAFYAMIGLQKPQEPNTRQVPSSVNTAAMMAPGSNTKNWAYYNNLRKTNPVQYNSKQVQAEMWEQAKKLGPDFNP